MNSVSEDSLMRRVKKWLKSKPMAAIPIMFYRVLRGYRAYRHILRDCPPEEGWRIYFMDYDGSGDTYLTCGYLQAKKQIDSKAAFAASGNLSLKIAKLFPFGRYTSVAPKSALTVRMMERFLGQKLRLSPLLYESEFLEYSGILRRMHGYRGLDFMLMLKTGLEISCKIPYDETPWEQPKFPYDQTELDEIFEKYDLIPGKTVVLAPYAGKHNMWGIPMGFYEELAERLKKDGYVVCTNSGDVKKEPIVPGTIPLFVSHRLMRFFCEQAGCFIGLRSGLCDIISAAEGCKKVILYAPDIPIAGVCSYQEFFSIRNMKLCIDAIEWEIGQNCTEKILSHILNIFN